MQTFSIKDVTSIMASGNFGVSYEPIKDAQNLQTFAYEALSRFKYKGILLSTEIFFKTLST